MRTAVLRAAGDALAEVGFAHLDLTDIARRANVGKTTVYRRWSTVPGLVADLLTDMAEQSLPRTETGTLLGDLQANARLVQRTLSDPRQGALFKAVIAAATSDPKTAEALHHFYETRITEWSPCIQHAINRGEVPPNTNPHEVIRAVSAPLYYRLLTSNAPLDKATADQAAQAATTAAQAGIYT
ncbi:TetR/AcrR family transcriptional regulator [Actinophytocola sediminis]